MNESSEQASSSSLHGRNELTRLIAPKSVAVIGASDTPGSFGRRTLENLLPGYAGRIYPINPKREEIMGLRCYPQLQDLPEVPDCAILAVPRQHVLGLLQICADAGVGGVILYTSGFAESGLPERVAEQQEMARIARASGMRILGPNCVGIINFVDDIGMHFMPKFRDMPMIHGRIGLVSQSGGLGYTVIQALERGIGFSHFLSAGNSCDVDACDLINYLVEDPGTDVVACIVEGVRDGGRLLEAGRRALAAGKPLIFYKMGRSEISKRTALSHTGTLAGSDAAYEAAFQRAGIVQVENWEELLETASLFAKAKPPFAQGVGVMASSGGAAVMAADKAELRGVHLPAPAAVTVARLQELVPDFGSISNPTDMTAETLKSFEMYGNCIRAFAEDPGYGILVVPMLSAQRPTTTERARYICEFATSLKKTICLVWLNEWLQGPGSETYEASAEVPMFRSMDRCMAAIRRWLDYHRNREGLLHNEVVRVAPTAAVDAARLLLDGAEDRVLSESRAKKVLGAYGVAVAGEGMAQDVEQAVTIAADIGYPVVMKADSPDIPHKTEAGVVKLGLRTEADVRRSHAEITAALRLLPVAPRLNGISVQQMVGGRVEMMVGATVDPHFGPMVTCGFGGIQVEVLKDVCTRLAPVDRNEALGMIHALRGSGLLTGYRNVPPMALDAFADLVSRISELVADAGGRIAEIDVNPVLLDETGAVAVDALIVQEKV
jgi:acyl-CoA synthetase (NDP forming)